MFVKTKKNKVYETKKIVFEEERIVFILCNSHNLNLKKSIKLEDIDYISTLSPLIYD